jgi:hypothetical protein
MMYSDIDVENVVPENQRATLRERWGRIQENQMSSTMSSGARFVERTPYDGRT